MRTRCGACDVALLRGVDDDPTKGWIVEGPGTDTSIRQSSARLRAFANEQDLEFEEPQEDQGVARAYLWVKRGPDDPKNERTARVWGSGRSKREALVNAVVDAESKGMRRTMEDAA